jgi:polysaccharide biosynthesis protein PslG
VSRPLVIALTFVAILAAGCSSGSSSDASSSTATSTPAPSGGVPGSASPSPSVTVSGSASATPAPSPSGPYVGEVVPAAITGLHVSGVQEGNWPDSNVPFGTLRLWDAGTNWSQVEAVKGQYNWAALDTALKTAEAHKVKDVLLVLGSTPTWNASRIRPGDYPVPGAASAPKSMAAWEAFVGAVVKRYAGRISAYQIWNEASLSMFWNGSPEKLADMTKSAYDIIKAKDPKAKVVAASTTVRLEGAFDRFFPKYLAALGKLGWPVDVFSAHLYPASKETTDERAAFVGSVKADLTAAGAPDVPLWDTELNYGLAGPGPTNPRQTIEGAKARDWVVQTALDSLHLGLDRTYWYIWTPQPYPLLGMQLTNDSGAVKGLRVVNQWVVGSTWKGCVDDGSVVSCSVDKKGIPSVIAWALVDSGTFTPPAGLTQACNTANKCTPVTGPVQLTETPMRFIQ